MEVIVERILVNFLYFYSFLYDIIGWFNSIRILYLLCNEKDIKILKIIDECEFKECYYLFYRIKIFKCIEEICKVKNIM